MKMSDALHSLITVYGQEEVMDNSVYTILLYAYM